MARPPKKFKRTQKEESEAPDFGKSSTKSARRPVPVSSVREQDESDEDKEEHESIKASPLPLVLIFSLTNDSLVGFI